MSDALEIEKRGKFKIYSYELAGTDVLGRDYGLVFPDFG